MISNAAQAECEALGGVLPPVTTLAEFYSTLWLYSNETLPPVGNAGWVDGVHPSKWCDGHPTQTHNRAVIDLRDPAANGQNEKGHCLISYEAGQEAASFCMIKEQICGESEDYSLCPYYEEWQEWTDYG